MPAQTFCRAQRYSALLIVAVGVRIVLPAALLSQGTAYIIKSTIRTNTQDVVAMLGRVTASAEGGRIDIQQADLQNPLYAAGDYILTFGSRMIYVHPSRQEYQEVSALQLAQGPMMMVPGMKLEISNVTVSGEKLGDGGIVDGHATRRVRVTSEYVMTLEMTGQRQAMTARIMAESWLADLDIPANPWVSPEPAAGDSLPNSPFRELIAKTSAALKDLGPGFPIKRVTTTSISLGNTQIAPVSETTNTTEITEIRQTSVDPTLFKIPDGFKKVDFRLPGR